MASAIDQFRRALEGREQRLGADHPDTLDAVRSLALLLHAQGAFDEAEPLLRRALEGREQQLGAQHLSTLTCVSNLASLLKAQGKLARGRAALPALRRLARGGGCALLGLRHAAAARNVRRP